MRFSLPSSPSPLPPPSLRPPSALPPLSLRCRLQIVGRDFEAGDLGPGTIVGSAAFNMLVIIAICISIDEVKKVEQIIVLYITAAASVFAYLWLYIIVEVWTPNLCTIEEAVITCAFFPVLLLIAFCADKGWFDVDVCSHTVKKVRGSLNKGLDTKSESERALEHLVSVGNVSVNANGTSEWKRDLRRAIKRVSKEHPAYTQDEIYVEAFEQVRQHPHSPVLSTYVPGKDTDTAKDSVGNPIKMMSTARGNDGTTDVGPGAPTARVGFLEGSYDCSEAVGKLKLTVERKGNMQLPLKLRIVTKDVTAKEDTHYTICAGKTVEFLANQKEATILIDIVEDDQYEPNHHFCIGLAPATDAEGSKISWSHRSVKIRILESYQFKGTCDKVIKTVTSFFAAIVSDEPAENAYVEQIRGSLRFEEDDDDDDDDDENPDTANVFRMEEGGDDGDAGDDDGPGLHSFMDWFFYFYGVLPKFFIAVLCPPVSVANGWGTFVISLCWIAFYTALCADLASQMGCTVGLKDSVTAVTFVALGTSVPDTFASKIAAEQDPNADPAIGNVTGSNAVNVFLGIGLSWLLGSVYQVVNNDKDGLEIPKSALGFSVLLFSIMSVVWFVVLTARRYIIGGELGGSGPAKWGVMVLFVVMWFLFIILVALVEYDVIPNFI